MKRKSGYNIPNIWINVSSRVAIAGSKADYFNDIVNLDYKQFNSKYFLQRTSEKSLQGLLRHEYLGLSKGRGKMRKIYQNYVPDLIKAYKDRLLRLKPPKKSMWESLLTDNFSPFFSTEKFERTISNFAIAGYYLNINLNIVDACAFVRVIEKDFYQIVDNLAEYYYLVQLHEYSVNFSNDKDRLKQKLRKNEYRIGFLISYTMSNSPRELFFRTQFYSNCDLLFQFLEKCLEKQKKETYKDKGIMFINWIKPVFFGIRIGKNIEARMKIGKKVKELNDSNYINYR